MGRPHNTIETFRLENQPFITHLKPSEWYIIRSKAHSLRRSKWFPPSVFTLAVHLSASRQRDATEVCSEESPTTTCYMIMRPVLNRQAEFILFLNIPRDKFKTHGSAKFPCSETWCWPRCLSIAEVEKSYIRKSTRSTRHSVLICHVF